MTTRNLSFFLAFLLARTSHASLSDYIRVEADAGDILKPKQPLLAQRDGRFLRFDSSDSEIELEFGVSVPFLKIPLKSSAGHEKPMHDNRLTINPAGLLVGASLLATSFLLVPLVVTPDKNHHKRTDSEMGYGDGGRMGGAWRLVDEVDQFLTTYNLDPRSCPQKALCMIGQQVTSPMPGFLEAVSRFDAVQNVAGISDLVKSMQMGSCDETYPSCGLSQQVLKVIPQILGFHS